MRNNRFILFYFLLSFCFQDLKPSNLAVNQDCELKVSYLCPFELKNSVENVLKVTNWGVFWEFFWGFEIVSYLWLQILDFGLARHADQEMTGYVVTRWYRAPEVILNWMHYNQTGKITRLVPFFFFTLHLKSWFTTHCLNSVPDAKLLLSQNHNWLCNLQSLNWTIILLNFNLFVVFY